MARILHFDLELSPFVGYTWGKWDQNVLEFIETYRVLSFAYKWEGDRGVKVVAQCDFDDYDGGYLNDRNVCAAMFDLLDEADIVVAHNGDRFDVPKINARLLLNGFSPPSPYHSIDTLKIVRREFAFASNSLANVCEELGIGKKMDSGGIETFLGCMSGDEKAWRHMKRYNKRDVQLSQKLYHFLRPWVKNHPSVNLMSGEDDACPRCGKVGALRPKGYRYTKVSKFRRYVCEPTKGGCGGWSRVRLGEIDKPRRVT